MTTGTIPPPRIPTNFSSQFFSNNKFFFQAPFGAPLILNTEGALASLGTSIPAIKFYAANWFLFRLVAGMKLLQISLQTLLTSQSNYFRPHVPSISPRVVTDGSTSFGDAGMVSRRTRKGTLWGGQATIDQRYRELQACIDGLFQDDAPALIQELRELAASVTGGGTLIFKWIRTSESGFNQSSKSSSSCQYDSTA